MLSAFRFADRESEGDEASTSPVQVPQVDMVGLEQLQRPVDGLRSILGVAAYAAAVWEGLHTEDHAELCREENVVPFS